MQNGYGSEQNPLLQNSDATHILKIDESVANAAPKECVRIGSLSTAYDDDR